MYRLNGLNGLPCASFPYLITRKTFDSSIFDVINTINKIPQVHECLDETVVRTDRANRELIKEIL